MTEVEEDKYKHILSTKNPDKEIEHFWYCLKDSMYNYLTQVDKDISFIKKIIVWSNELNLLQQQKLYVDITEKIEDHILDYARLLIKKDNIYHNKILNTNIKRWRKITGRQFNPPFISLYNVFESIIYKKKPYHEILSIIRNCEKPMDGINKILDIAFDNKLGYIINHLKEHVNITTYVKDRFDIYVHPHTKGEKILKLIRYRKNTSSV